MGRRNRRNENMIRHRPSGGQRVAIMLLGSTFVFMVAMSLATYFYIFMDSLERIRLEDAAGAESPTSDPYRPTNGTTNHYRAPVPGTTAFDGAANMNFTVDGNGAPAEDVILYPLPKSWLNYAGE